MELKACSDYAKTLRKWIDQAQLPSKPFSWSMDHHLGGESCNGNVRALRSSDNYTLSNIGRREKSAQRQNQARGSEGRSTEDILDDTGTQSKPGGQVVLSCVPNAGIKLSGALKMASNNKVP